MTGSQENGSLFPLAWEYVLDTWWLYSCAAILGAALGGIIVAFVLWPLVTLLIVLGVPAALFFAWIFGMGMAGGFGL